MLKQLAAVVVVMATSYGAALSPTTAAASPRPGGWSGVVPPKSSVLRVTGRANEVGGGLTVVFSHAQPRPVTVKVTASDMVNGNQHWHTSTLPGKDKTLKDALLEVRVSPIESLNFLRRLYFIRPDAHFYIYDDLKQTLVKWKRFPPASKHTFTLTFTGIKDAVNVSIDGRYLVRLPRASLGKQIEVRPFKGGELLTAKSTPGDATARYQPLDISHTRSQSDVMFSDLSLTDEGRAALAAAHVQPADLDKYVDVGKSRWLWQATDPGKLYPPYTKRSAWDNLPERIIFAIPPNQYVRAHFLCALRADDGRKPAMTVRLARYNLAWNGAAAMYGDTTATLNPDAPSPAGVTMEKVGTVRMSLAGRAQRKAVYLVTVPLRSGELAGGMLAKNAGRRPVYGRAEEFSLELSRVMGQRHNTGNGNFGWLPVGPQSGVVVLGASLEKPPISLLVRSSQRDLVFYRDQGKGAALEVIARNPFEAPQHVVMKANLSDYNGKRHPLRMSLTIPAGSSTHRLPLTALDYGWYGGRFVFTDQNGQILWRQRVSFVLLPPDTRQATYEQSPFSIWLFNGWHDTTDDADTVLPLVRKLGFRRVAAPNPLDPAKMHEYGVLPGTMGYLGDDMKKVAKGAAEFHKNYPNVHRAMIFHETAGTGETIHLAPELFGGTYKPRDAEHQKRFEQLWATAVDYVKTVRQAAPKMKFILGNGRTNFNLAWLRAKFPRQYFDAIGMEMAVQLFHPESQPMGWNLQSYWIAKRLAQIHGYESLPIADCYEADYRTTSPGALPSRKQANWYARDVLLRLAYRAPTISVGILEDVSDGYYYSRWGASGVLEHAPLMMPKRSFASLSTLTRVLDRATFQRWIPLGSTSAYCLEFKRPDGNYVYALWTSRGEMSARMTFTQPMDSLSLVYSPGNSGRYDPNQPLTISASPCYVISPAPVRQVGCEATPRQGGDALDHAQEVASPDPKSWHVAPGKRFVQWAAYEPLKCGEATLSADAPGMRVTLTPKPNLPGLVSQVIALAPDGGPIPIEGRPDTVAVWINGHGNWGRVMFGLVDAAGKHWISEGYSAGPQSWGLGDWVGHTAINFDGWRLITQPLPLRYPSGYYGPHYHDWHCVNGDNIDKNRIAYPVRLSHIYLTFRQKLVYVNEMVKANSLSINVGKVMAGNTGRALVYEGAKGRSGEWKQ